MSISVIVNAHREGYLLLETIKSVELACAELSKIGVGFEVIIVVDSGDKITTKLAVSFSKAKVLQVSHRDLGESRNTGVAQSSFDYIAFVDGDDLISRDWLAACIVAAKKHEGKCIFHPEINYFFGERGSALRSLLFSHTSSTDNDFLKWTLVDQNPWTSLCFAERKIFEETPYRKSEIDLGTGFEDWSFNLESLAKGVKHISIPGTVHFLRQKKTSMKLGMASRNARIEAMGFLKEL